MTQALGVALFLGQNAKLHPSWGLGAGFWLALDGLVLPVFLRDGGLQKGVGRTETLLPAPNSHFSVHKSVSHPESGRFHCIGFVFRVRQQQ